MTTRLRVDFSRIQVGVIALLFAAACAPAAPAAPTPKPAAPSAQPAATSAPPVAPAQSTAATNPAPGTEQSGGQLVFGIHYESATYDPNTARHTSVPNISSQIFETLLVRAADGSLKGHLATSWEAAPDGLSYTFKLRPNVKFHDGTPFNAEAVKFNFDRIVDPATKSLYTATLIPEYKSAEVVDDQTVRIFLKTPSAPFLDTVSRAWFGMVSPSAVQKYGADFEQHLIGTGPFRLKDRVQGEQLTLERNPDYAWPPPTAQHQGPAYLDTVQFKFLAEPGTRVGTLSTGETQFITEVPIPDVVRFQKDPRYQVFLTPMAGGTSFFFFNASRPPTDSLEVRQAVLQAIDMDAIVTSVWGGLAKRAQGPISSVTIGYDKSVEGMNPYSPDKAKAMLDAAGWQSGPDGIRLKDGQPLKLLVVYYQSPFELQAMQLAQAQLKQVGVDVELNVMAPLAYIDAGGKGEDNMVGLSVTGTDPSLLTAFFHNKQGQYNWSKHNLDELNGLLEQGTSTLDPAKRDAVYAQIQQQIMRNALIMPIAETVWMAAARAEVQGVSYTVEGYPRLYDVSLKR
jgi:peptide/nickel transport system substrate-binding protein